MYIDDSAMNLTTRRCRMAWHLFIQWLASKDILDMWLTDMVNRESGIDPSANFNPYSARVAEGNISYQSGDHPYQFLRWRTCSPQWGRSGHPRYDTYLKLNEEWNEVADQIKIMFEEHGDMI